MRIGVACAHLHVAQRIGDLGHALLVAASVDEGAASVVEHLLQRDHLAGALRVPGLDHVQGLVEDDLVAAEQLGGVKVRVQRHAHLAPRGEDVDGAVRVDAEERPVGGRRLRELLDLLAQQRELLLGLLERVGELLVLRDRLLELAARLQEPLLERLDPRRLVVDAATSHGDVVGPRVRGSPDAVADVSSLDGDSMRPPRLVATIPAPPGDGRPQEGVERTCTIGPPASASRGRVRHEGVDRPGPLHR